MDWIMYFNIDDVKNDEITAEAHQVGYRQR
jgi:hypothetical protein